jgi:4-hydroxybenzoate polyprenyltransferase
MHPSDIVRLMRPRQWTKNLAVFAGIIFSGSLFNMSMLPRVIVGFVALDLVAGAVYAYNDANDAELDRMHPIKRDRPVAAGRITRTQAYLISLVLMAGGIAIAAMLGAPFLVAVLSYVVLHVVYGMALKHVAIVDMLAIALGFVIRAVAGVVVIDVPGSPWLVLCTGMLALFLAAAKRRHELVMLGDRSSEHRPVLSQYTAELLDSFMVTLSAATITSYALYTFFEKRAPGYTLMFTIPFVIYGVLRYQYLVLSKEGGGQPEEVLLGDRPILGCVGLWAASAVVVLYALPHIWP